MTLAPAYAHDFAPHAAETAPRPATAAVRPINGFDAALASRQAALQAYPRMRELAMGAGLPLHQIPDMVTPWHTWELIGLLTGMAPELANLGRETFARAEREGWSVDGQGFECAKELLRYATRTPDQAYWEWLEIAIRHGGLPAGMPE
jgi:hypothetical protein